VAIVTGAARGIGEVYASALARQGAAVVLVDVLADEAGANAAAIEARGGQAIAVAADLGDPAEVATMVERAVATFGGVDILVNNGAIYGGYESFTLEEIPLEYLQRFYAVNATGILVACQAVIPHMRARGGGRIVNQSSTAADLMYNQYGLTKLLLQGLTVALAHELGGDRITVNAIAPGPIATAATTDKYPVEPFLEALAIKRMGRPEDLAGLLAFLVSDAGEWVTGQTIHVNGGFWMRPA